MSGDEPQVVIVEDHLAVAKGVELILRHDGIRVIGVAADAAEGMRLIIDRRPEVAIVDIGLAGRSGIELAREATKLAPGVAVLLYTGGVTAAELQEALDSGARGFAFKAGGPGELVAAVQALAAGGEYVDPRVAAMLGSDSRKPAGALTEREREIILHVAAGLTTTEVAQRLTLSAQTVDTHVKNVIRKLGARNRVHAVAMVLRDRDRAIVR